MKFTSKAQNTWIWHQWYAWFPVVYMHEMVDGVWHTRWVWGETIWRRRDYWGDYVYLLEYREEDDSIMEIGDWI